ncbi:MAG: glycerophosphodiester phosphodiesterase [Dehalococcoidia bacterium]|nr:MAG: glycerophosphodiester phosphodiesterase [Dehalococcoidia bacterium]
MTEPNGRPKRPFLEGARPLAFAHRGGSKIWPENTMVAFQGAVQLGCRYLETDLHTTRDGVLVTIHDETLDRVSDGSGPVHALTLAELKRFDAGYRFSPDGGQSFPFRGKGVTVPTLAEVTQAFPDICLNLEIKQKETSLVEALVTFIEEENAHDRTLVGSFHDRMLKEFRRRTGGRVATSAASWEARLFWLASRLGLTRFLRLPYDALQVPPCQGRLPVVDRRFVQAAHRLGIQVHVWTVDESEEMRRLLNLGVDGLMSDRPDLLLDVVRLSHPQA